jgi:hypothetical protein
MKKIIKSKTFLSFMLFCLFASVLLAVFNFSQFKKYQMNQRNQQRESDVEQILSGIKRYISTNNNLPTTSNPDTASFLPELLFVGSNPTGGVNVSTLENMQEYFNIGIKDPAGDPYLVGTYEDQVVVYTNRFEREENSSEVYFKVFKVTSSVDGKVTTE